MDLERIKKQWADYNEEFDNSDFMDIDTHTSMAMQVGVLIAHIEKQSKENTQLINLNLWSARRLPKSHKETAYDGLVEITGENHERL